MKYYTGNITPEPDTIFVFGSNPEGRHGSGSAKVARLQFGAIYGQGEGLQGNAYALPTTELRYQNQTDASDPRVTNYARQSLPFDPVWRGNATSVAGEDCTRKGTSECSVRIE